MGRLGEIADRKQQAESTKQKTDMLTCRNVALPREGAKHGHD
jgi:hypothetical protein